MRQSDTTLPPEAVARKKREAARFWAGLVIAAAGLAAVFVMGEVYFGFTVALIGAGIVPVEKIAEVWRR